MSVRIRYIPSPQVRYFLAVAVAAAAEGDLLAVSSPGWKRAMAPALWARAGRWYRAALEAHEENEA